jgi:formate dehydrogenase subunit delta
MMSNLERLVYMANQIARNFEAIGHDAAAKATADHIASFWDPRMKSQIFALIDTGEADLSLAAREALLSLRRDGAPAPQTRATEFNAANEAGHADAG